MKAKTILTAVLTATMALSAIPSSASAQVLTDEEYRREVGELAEKNPDLDLSVLLRPIKPPPGYEDMEPNISLLSAFATYWAGDDIPFFLEKYNATDKLGKLLDEYCTDLWNQTVEEIKEARGIDDISRLKYFDTYYGIVKDENGEYHRCELRKHWNGYEEVIVIGDSIYAYYPEECENKDIMSVEEFEKLSYEEAILFTLEYNKEHEDSPFTIGFYSETHGGSFVVDWREAIGFVCKGKCGENATWKLYDTGTVLITGTGTIDNTDELRKYSSEFVSLNVFEGITSIESYAFKDFTNIVDVFFSEETKVEANAFDGCSNLKYVSIPYYYNSSISSEAFYNTPWFDNLKNANDLVVCVNKVINGVDCNGDVEIPEGVTMICDGAFSNSEITSIKLPETIETIGANAFSNCKNLKEITIPKNVSKIGDTAFTGCSSLEEIVIENPMCVIYESNGTINNIQLLEDEYMYTGVIRGLKGSTAEIYAKTYGIEFAEIKTESIKGDANCDGNVNMADAVIIMQSLANPDKYGVDSSDETHITEQGIANGDMDGNGLTNADALEIQKKILKLS